MLLSMFACALQKWHKWKQTQEIIFDFFPGIDKASKRRDSFFRQQEVLMVSLIHSTH